MDGLADFVEEDELEQLHVMNVEYTDYYDEPIVHLYCRTEDGERRHVEVEGHRPSFYIRKEDFSRRIVNNDWVQGVEQDRTTIHGEELVRIETKLPKHVGGTRDRDGLREHFEKTWEADVFYTSRFLIDTEIKTHFEVDTEETREFQSMDGDYRVDVEHVTAIEDPEWKVEPRTVVVDIEVESPNGFPEPEDAVEPVTAITAYDNYDGEYTVWALRHDSWDHTDTEIQNMVVRGGDSDVVINDVHVHDSEDAMLDAFNTYVDDRRPDLLSGWNSSTTDNGDAFDYPYLINRCRALNVSSFEKWSPSDAVWTTRRGRGQNLTAAAKGVSFFDMMQAYKKTQWSEPKGGWGLDNISGKELGVEDAKLELEDIDSAWAEEPSEFLQYNVRDVECVVAIDATADVMELFQNIRALAGTQFDNCYNNIDLLDVLILRYGKEMGYALPTNEEPERGWYYGAHVFEPELGRHPNVVYPDLWSMYPNMIRNCNMSPETIIGTAEDLEASEYTEEECRWTYVDTRPTNVKEDSNPVYEKLYFVDPEIERGFMYEVVDDLMQMKDHYDGTPLYDAVKRIVNSVYGVYGDSDSYGKGYRLFDWRIAEGITLGGRKMIQDTAERYVDALNEIKDEREIEGQNAYLVLGDTDSAACSIPYMDAATREDYEEIVDLAQDAAERVNEWYDGWTEYMFNCHAEHYCELEIESYAPWCFVPEGATKEKAKKRYAEIIAWDEGDWEDPPEFSVTGIDIVRSDRAPVTREVLSDVLQSILRIDDPTEAREEVYDRIKSEYESIHDGECDNEHIARPRGMSKAPERYGSAKKTPMPTYRGAKYANQNFDWEQVTSGDKPALLYLDKVRGDWPKTYTAETRENDRAVDAVAVNAPNDVPGEFVIDTDKQVEKVLEDPLTPILSPMNWTFEDAIADSEASTLSEFM